MSFLVSSLSCSRFCAFSFAALSSSSSLLSILSRLSVSFWFSSSNCFRAFSSFCFSSSCDSFKLAISSFKSLIAFSVAFCFSCKDWYCSSSFRIRPSSSLYLAEISASISLDSSSNFLSNSCTACSIMFFMFWSFSSIAFCNSAIFPSSSFFVVSRSLISLLMLSLNSACSLAASCKVIICFSISSIFSSRLLTLTSPFSI